MPSNPSTTAFDFHASVAAQFANRPGLRQIAAERIMQLLIEHHPILKTARPDMHSAEGLMLMTPGLPLRPLVDLVLQALIDGKLLDLSPVDNVAQYFCLEPARRFYAIEDSMTTGEGDVIKPERLQTAFDELIRQLPDDFCQAQVDYWRATGSMGVDHLSWLQQLLKSALLCNLPWQVLDEQQAQCVRELLARGNVPSGVYLVQVELDIGGATFSETLPNLLIQAQWDERESLLWCAPSGIIRAFDSFDEFAAALADELGVRYRFEAMTWHRFALEGDCFVQQAAMLLDILLATLSRLRPALLADVGALEQAYASLSDPASFFIPAYSNVGDTKLILPPGLNRASSEDSFAYHCGLFELALAQADSDGIAALDGILDLHGYASQRLREQMLSDHPIDANYFADDLLLTLSVARGVPGGAGAGVGGGVVETRKVSLTQLAVGNLSSLAGATVTAIEHRDDQLIMDWMNVEYVKALIQRVDIGAHYPVYVADRLDEPAQRELRVSRFAREWRCSFLFSALQTKLAGSLSEAALQAVVNYCRGLDDQQLPGSMLMPLAFRREPSSEHYDLVRGMYVLFCVEPAVVVLYRPLYASRSVCEFASLDAMMQAIRSDMALQQDILEWILPQARSVYAHGGFTEPHLGVPVIDSSLLPERVQPPAFWPQYWRVDVDAKMYAANRDLLVELADRQSVSNAESRWAILCEGAWLLFDLITLQLRGPVAVVAWMVQLAKSVDTDLTALAQASAFGRSAAVVDLILNAGMALLHARLPQLQEPVPVEQPPLDLLRGPTIAGNGASTAMTRPVQGKVYLPGEVLNQASVNLDFSFSGGQGFNVLPPQRRQALLAMRSAVSLNGIQPLSAGPEQGLYIKDGEHYVSLRGDTYAVALSAEGARIEGRDGAVGPWLLREFGAWRIDARLRLDGGMPRNRVQRLQETKKQQLALLKNQESALIVDSEPRRRDLEKYIRQEFENKALILDLEQEASLDSVQVSKLALLRSLQKRYSERVAGGYKRLIEVDRKHDRILTEITAVRSVDPLLDQVLDAQRSDVRRSLVENCGHYYNRLADMINDGDMEEQREQLMVLPETEVEIQHYRDFTKALEGVQVWEQELIELSGPFDALLEETLKDSTIHFKSEEGGRDTKAQMLNRIIEARRANAVDLEFRMLQDLAELSLDRLGGADEATLNEYQNYLNGPALASAGAAHAELAGADLALSERLEVLNGVMDAYEEAASMADYLLSVGKRVIRADKLRLYQQTLGKLKDSVRIEIASDLRELELADVPRVRTPLYAKRGGTRRVVRTHRGRSVVGEEVQVDGESVIQQRDSYSKVLKTFRRQNSAWVEDAESNPLDRASPSTQGLASVRRRGRTLLDEMDSVVKIARRYVSSDEPLGLSTVLELHREKLSEVLAALPRSEGDAALYEDLETGIESLQATQDDLLRSIYFNTTHPTARALKYLHEQKQLTIVRTVKRRPLPRNDYLDIYEIKRLAVSGHGRGIGLWEAHFHYASEGVADLDFVAGHLKTWAQRALGRDAQLRAAQNSEVLEIYRSKLTKADVLGIIPFE
ncbi:dermonecrotic toxin domain-containing protein [Pseudomonas plecoglossicida]|uniref:dermonecrotic toxin domain-containing protein n=1 Tax=Pseudomonas plecoglossicida TaxID=70775 RepID=UPI0015E40F2C|nr:DUF6543 domain-containing protein [Pseudomonas plecoglossicida]MBA1320169.1 hypothetical protein [Pseudomonas plecoglossicida]